MTSDCSDILERIIADKRLELPAVSAAMSRYKAVIRDLPAPLDFRTALRRQELAVIAEIKKASPSAGVICDGFDPGRIASAYKAAGADAISVLTDKKYFQGDIAYLGLVRETAPGIPVLRKDFIIAPEQIYESRAAGADSFLLIARVLELEQMKELIAMGRELGMEPLVESHSLEDIEKSVRADTFIYGINNRNLKTFSTDISVSEDLHDLIPGNCISVSESGISSPSVARRLRDKGFDAVLVGESLMRLGVEGCGEAIKKLKSQSLSAA
ncbi:MAG: indole-3-glycerol phosphate synthase TrpC [Victivallales bacterium]|nr:indole-3-glycerol phosphate synthase TrpC [Victivallales bacterium]